MLCGRSKWHNSNSAVLCRLCSNPQSLADPESSQSVPAVLSRLRSSPSSPQPKSSQPARALRLDLSQTRVAGIDAFAGALICYAAWRGLPSCPRMLLRSPAFPPIGHCVTWYNGWVGQEYKSPQKYAEASNIYIYIYNNYIYIYI